MAIECEQTLSDSIEELQRSLSIYKGLVEVGSLLHGILEFRPLLRAILNVARRVVEAEAASLFLINPQTQNLELVVASGPNGEASEFSIVIPKEKGIAGWVFSHNESVLVNDAYNDPRFLVKVDMKSGFRTRSILCSPLVYEGTPIGVLQLLNARNQKNFQSTDLEALDAYASMCAIAIDRIQNLEKQKQQEKLNQELSLASEIQRSFLPTTLPQSDVFEYAYHYRPAHNIGGDFYDLLEVNETTQYFVIGDVSGKGIPAALQMAQCLNHLRMILLRNPSPEVALQRWQDSSGQKCLHQAFITAIIGRVHLKSQKIEMALAGHPPPILKCADGQAEEVQMPGVPPVGVPWSSTPARFECQLAPGEHLLFYTDGLEESFNPQREIFGSKKILQTLQQLPSSPQDSIQALVAAEAAHRGDAPPNDDLTLLCIGRK